MKRKLDDWHETWSIPRDDLLFGRRGATWSPIANNGQKLPVEGTLMEFDRNGIDYRRCGRKPTPSGVRMNATICNKSDIISITEPKV